MAALLNDGGTLALGFGFGAASMLSVGPNNLMLIREGLARGRAVTVATTVWSSYLLLLLSAMIFVNVRQWIGPSAGLWIPWLGLASLSWFAASAWRAAFSPKGPGTDRHAEARHTCLKRVLAVVWCNPLTYLELFLVPAACCAALGSLYQRSEFIGGVAIMNAVTCYGYALGGGVCGRHVSNRRAVRVFDVVSGFLLTGSAVALALALTLGT